MSGGQWDYRHFVIRDVCEQAANDLENLENDPERAEELKGFYPEFQEMLMDVGSVLTDILHKLDYHLSGDSLISDKKAFENEARNRLMEAIMNGIADKF